MKMKQSTDRLKVGRTRSVAAYDSVADGTVMVARGPHHDAIVKPFNDSGPPKSVGVLRCRRHHFMTGGLGLPDTAKKFPIHADKKPAYAGRPARRIVRADGEQHTNEPSGGLEKSNIQRAIVRPPGMFVWCREPT